MPKLQPIRFIRYTTDDGDLSTKIAPPYDVLDEDPKQHLLQRDPRNIVEIDLPVTPPKTVGPDEAYEQAGRTLRQWLEEGTLTEEPAEAIVAYEQVYTIDGQTYHRRGIFGGLTVEPFNRPDGGIWRHELTIKSGVGDRYKLMEATGAQLSPVFGVFHDPDGEVVGKIASHFHRPPDLFGTTENDGVEHRCWIINDEATLTDLQRFFEGRNVFIADGHHRYTTALQFHEDHPELPAAERCLFVLVAIEDPGMIVLPTHRVIHGLSDFAFEDLAASIDKCEQLTLTPTDHGPSKLGELEAALPEAGPHAMGIYDPASGKTAMLTATDDDPLAGITADKPEVWRKLDLAVLHELVIERLLKPSFGGDSVAFKYTAELGAMREMAEEERGRLAVIMQPTSLEEVSGVSLADEVMPPKSTFFYPKLATGLVVNPLQ